MNYAELDNILTRKAETLMRYARSRQSENCRLEVVKAYLKQAYDAGVKASYNQHQEN